jgi:hypothetical protein
MLPVQLNPAVEALHEVELARLRIDLAGGFPLFVLLLELRIAAEPGEDLAVVS